MKLKLRIGRQHARASETAEAVSGRNPADRPQGQQPARTAEPVLVPLPRTPAGRIVRAGSFCRASEVGQSAVTASGRTVHAISAGRCGRWVFDDRAGQALPA